MALLQVFLCFSQLPCYVVFVVTPNMYGMTTSIKVVLDNAYYSVLTARLEIHYFDLGNSSVVSHFYWSIIDCICNCQLVCVRIHLDQWGWWPQQRHFLIGHTHRKPQMCITRLYVTSCWTTVTLDRTSPFRYVLLSNDTHCHCTNVCLWNATTGTQYDSYV